jgi:hypothetical protein
MLEEWLTLRIAFSGGLFGLGDLSPRSRSLENGILFLQKQSSVLVAPKVESILRPDIVRGVIMSEEVEPNFMVKALDKSAQELGGKVRLEKRGHNALIYVLYDENGKIVMGSTISESISARITLFKNFGIPLSSKPDKSRRRRN